MTSCWLRRLCRIRPIFLQKKDKKQNKDQQNQSAHATSIFYEIRWTNSNKKGDNEARTINKRLPPLNTIEKLLTKSDLASVYNVPWRRLDENFKGSPPKRNLRTGFKGQL